MNFDAAFDFTLGLHPRVVFRYCVLHTALVTTFDAFSSYLHKNFGRKCESGDELTNI